MVLKFPLRYKLNEINKLSRNKCNILEGFLDSGDEELSLEAFGSIHEFRRLKRIWLARKKRRLIYRKTPTPEKYSRDFITNNKININEKKRNKFSLNSSFNETFDNHIKDFKLFIKKRCLDFRVNFINGPDPCLCEADF